MTEVSWPYVQHGDVEAVIVDILLNLTPELSASQVTISTNLIGYNPSARWVQVFQEGGLERWPVLYRPRIDLDVYAERRSVALDITQICLASVRRQAGKYDDYGFRYSEMVVESGPTRIPDNLQETTRYVTSMRLYGRSSTPLPPPT